MGSGKGAPEYWVAVVKPGRVMFELAGVSEDKAREAMRLAMHKLPVKCKFVKREDLEDKEVVQALILDIFKNWGYKNAMNKEKLLIFDKDGTKKLRSIDDIVDENITICYSDVILPQSAVDIAREDGIRYYFQTSERCHKFNPHIQAEYQREDVSN